MRQEEIRALLEEAANPNCDGRRRTSIQCLLDSAMPGNNPDGSYKITGWTAGQRALLNGLYVQTLTHRPELLPTLFPVFAAICGDREDPYDRTAKVDWSLMPE